MKIKRLLNQKAVYWASAEDDGYGGKAFTPGIEIDVRWEDKIDWFTNADGNEVLSDSSIFSDQELNAGGYLFLGTLDDLSSSECGDDPSLEHNAYEIKKVEKIPNIKGNQFFSSAFLSSARS